jgi:hypothetical protein
MNSTKVREESTPILLYSPKTEAEEILPDLLCETSMPQYQSQRPCLRENYKPITFINKYENILNKILAKPNPTFIKKLYIIIK